MTPTIVPLDSANVSAFVDTYFMRRPVVFRGLAATMPAYTKWTDAYLAAAFDGVSHLATLPDERRARMRLVDYLEYLGHPHAFASSVGPVYMTDVYLRPSVLGERLDALEPDARCPLPRPGVWAERVTIYMGTPRTGAALHQDIFDTQSWMAQIRGRKHWRLCAPETEWTACARPVDLFASTDVTATIYDVVLGPGDVLYVPARWWHQIRNDEANIAVAGHFSTVAEARAALAAAQADPDPQTRAEWPPLWQQILALHGRTDASAGAP